MHESIRPVVCACRRCTENRHHHAQINSEVVAIIAGAAFAGCIGISILIATNWNAIANFIGL